MTSAVFIEGEGACPKCGATSGDSWACGGLCPIPASPSYSSALKIFYDRKKQQFGGLTEAQLKLLCKIHFGGGGVPDRFGRIIVMAEVISAQNSPAAILRLIADEYVMGVRGRFVATDRGAEVATNYNRLEDQNKGT